MSARLLRHCVRRPAQRPSARQLQRGVTLFFGMLFLLTIVLLALGGVAMSRYQQRLALAMNDREFAFQGATLALRAAELDIQGLSANGAAVANPLLGFNADAPQMPVGLDNCPTSTTIPANFNGICQQLAAVSGTAGTSLAAINPFANNNLNWANLPNRSVNDVGFAYPRGNNNRAPGFVIEAIPDGRVATASGAGTAPLFRITAVGWGRFPSTQVRLQEIYRPYTLGNTGQ